LKFKDGNLTAKSGQRDLSGIVRDNIDELLVKIIEFTCVRNEIISNNISNCHLPGFVPKKLDDEEFATLISYALSEHLKNNRLMLRDGECVRFFDDGAFDINAKIDIKAVELFRKNFPGYISLQKKRRRENLANNRIAVALLEQKIQKSR